MAFCNYLDIHRPVCLNREFCFGYYIVEFTKEKLLRHGFADEKSQMLFAMIEKSNVNNQSNKCWALAPFDTNPAIGKWDR